VRRLEVFRCDDDYNTYLELISKSCKKARTEVWAYCLCLMRIISGAAPEHTLAERMTGTTTVQIPE